MTDANHSGARTRRRYSVPQGKAAAKYVASDPVVRDVALALGIREPSAHQLLYGADRINRRFLIIVSAFARHEAWDRLARWTNPVRAALAGVGLSRLTSQLLFEVQQADLEEDGAENAWRREPSDQNARAWVRAIDRAIQRLLQLRQSLVSHHNLDGEA